ncbi:MAG: putative glycoside hydrolase [Longimicrobiales bacterium]
MDPNVWERVRAQRARVEAAFRRRWPIIVGLAIVLVIGAFAVPRAATRAPAAEPVDGATPGASDAVALAASSETAATEPEPALGTDIPVTTEVATRPVDPALLAVSATPVETPVPKPDAVRGIYLNVWAAASQAKRTRLMDLADRTELNAFVIDVKDATGMVSFPSTIPLVARIGARGERRVADMREFLSELRRRRIYPIARIVVFRDPVLAKARPQWAMRRGDGSIWTDRYGDVWVDPYNRNVWDYNIAVALEALALGFSEIQWDYVRFPDSPARLMKDVVYPAAEARTKAQAITEFLRYSRERVREHHPEALVTADVFGLTTSVVGDMGIGQDWSEMVDATDALLPMVYPSHYVRGSYGVAYPNGEPYEIVRTALEAGVRRRGESEDLAAIRPWLQDFSLGEPEYGPAHVRAQIEATYDAGLDEWVLWNPASNYSAEALADKRGRAPDFALPHWTPGMEPPDSPGLRLLGMPADSIGG